MEALFSSRGLTLAHSLTPVPGSPVQRLCVRLTNGSDSPSDPSLVLRIRARRRGRGAGLASAAAEKARGAESGGLSFGTDRRDSTASSMDGQGHGLDRATPSPSVGELAGDPLAGGARGADAHPRASREIVRTQDRTLDVGLTAEDDPAARASADRRGTTGGTMNTFADLGTEEPAAAAARILASNLSDPSASSAARSPPRASRASPPSPPPRPAEPRAEPHTEPRRGPIGASRPPESRGSPAFGGLACAASSSLAASLEAAGARPSASPAARVGPDLIHGVFPTARPSPARRPLKTAARESEPTSPANAPAATRARPEPEGLAEQQHRAAPTSPTSPSAGQQPGWRWRKALRSVLRNSARLARSPFSSPQSRPEPASLHLVPAAPLDDGPALDGDSAPAAARPARQVCVGEVRPGLWLRWEAEAEAGGGAEGAASAVAAAGGALPHDASQVELLTDDEDEAEDLPLHGALVAAAAPAADASDASSQWLRGAAAADADGVDWTGILDGCIPELAPGATHEHTALAAFSELGLFQLTAEVAAPAPAGGGGRVLATAQLDHHSCGQAP